MQIENFRGEVFVGNTRGMKYAEKMAESKALESRLSNLEESHKSLQESHQSLQDRFVRRASRFAGKNKQSRIQQCYVHRHQKSIPQRLQTDKIWRRRSERR
jgi:hypothetical protein